jgi:hypothetical protein
MDRVVLGGCFLLVALGVLLGLGISAEQSTWQSIRAAMELLSFAGTAVTGVVAVVALTSWQSQFRHTERFKSLKELKDASLDLHKFIFFLHAIASRHIESLGGGSQVSDHAGAEEVARQQWFAALDVYRRAWGVAVVFLTPEEVNGFCGPVKVFNDRTFEYSWEIITSYSKSPPDEKLKDLLAAAERVTSATRELYDKTVLEVEQMLARHAVA